MTSGASGLYVGGSVRSSNTVLPVSELTNEAWWGVYGYYTVKTSSSFGGHLYFYVD